MKKYNKCTKCDIDKELNYGKYCNECRRDISITNLQNAKYVPKDKACRNCNETFLAVSSGSLYCDICGSEIGIEKRNITNDNYRKRKGIDVGIGSGNNQGRGSEHHSYKNGIGNYRAVAREAKGNTCERCKVILDFSTKKHCVHHKDHNRNNNALDNLELLCRRCHALEHDCINNLPNG